MKVDRISGIFLFFLGLAVLLKSLTYPIGTLRRPGGGLFPLIASLLLMGLSALMTVQTFRPQEGEKTAPGTFFSGKEAPKRIVLGFAALLGFRYLLPVIGFAPSTFVFILFLTKLLGNYSWKGSILFSVITSISAYYLFQVWLRIPMPRTIFGI